MKTIKLKLFATLLSLVFCLSAGYQMNAQTFTAVASGDWSSSATWLVDAPGANETDAQIIIPAGITVTLDTDVQLDGNAGVLEVGGELNSGANYSLTINDGTLAGTGSITLDELTLEGSATALFAGSLAAETFNTSVTTLTLVADISVENNLNLMAGVVTLDTGGNLSVGSDAIIEVSGGAITVGGGSISFSGNYSVIYSGSNSVSTGAELSGMTLTDLTIEVGAGQTVTLNNDVHIEGVLSIENGTLELNGNNLEVTGDISASGEGELAASVSGSDISVSSGATVSGGLHFTTENNQVNEFSIHVGSAGELTISGNLDVEGNLFLESGVLVLNDSELTINGDLTGEGMLSADAESALTINAEGGITSGLNFESDGQLIGDLTVNIGDGNTLTLDSDLTVDGTLHIEPGNTVDISGVSLTLDGDLTGNGQFSADNNTALAINAEGGTSADLIFDPTTQEIGDLTINIGSGNTLDLNSDLSVDGTLELAGESNLDISGRTLSVNGDLTGDGSFSTDADSDLAINVQGGTSGDLNFHSEANTIGNLTVNVGADNNVTLSSDLVVQEDLSLESGVLVLNDSELTINGDLTGEGMLSADAESALTINAEGGITSGLNFESDGQLIGDLTVNIGDGNTLSLHSDLTVDGTLHIESGNTLDISGVSLTLDGDLTGNGQFNANSETCLVISASQSITSALSFITDGNVVGKLTIDIDGGGSAHLDSDLVVSSELNLMNGQLVLNGYNIEVDGELNLTGDAEIHSTSDSDISLNLTGSPSGELNFSSDGNTVNQLWIEIDDGGSLTLGSELIIDGELAFGGNGSIRLNDFDLFVSGDAGITGSGGNSYIITAAGGSLVVEIQSEGSATFPVGTEANFSPAIIELNSGSSSGNLMVNVASGVYSEGYSGFNMAQDQSVVDATWFVNTDIDAGLDMDLEVWWNSEMEVNNFDRSEVYLSHFFEGSWDATATAEANLESDGMVSTRREGITALSPFAVFDQNTVVSIREITTVDLEVYPNPTSDKITITGLEESNNQINLNVYNSVGQLMNSYRFSGPNIELNMDGYENGNYFIRIYNDDLDLIRQIVKVKP